MSDPRFARLKTDPRFRRIKKDKNKVVVDDRFKDIFKEKGKKKGKQSTGTHHASILVPIGVAHHAGLISARRQVRAASRR